jgi:cytochrome P450
MTVVDPFIGTRQAALAASATYGSPDPLIPDSTPVLWRPVPPFRATSKMPLRLGSTRMRTWHISDMATGRRVLALRDKPSVDGQLVATSDFEPHPLRWARRHLGLAGALLDRHPSAGGPWMLQGAVHDAGVALVGAPFMPAEVEKRRGLIEDTARAVLAEHLDRDRDVLDVSLWANDVMFRLMAYALGAQRITVADTMARTFRSWMHGYNQSKSLAAMAYQPQIYAQLAAWIRRPPGPTGILAELHDARARRDHLGHDRPATMADCVSLAWAGIAAATDTPGVSLTQAAWFLTCARWPMGDFDEARNVMLESLRYHPPFTRPLFTFASVYEIAVGCVAEPGDYCEVHLPAINRDPTVFTYPDEWNPGRDNLRAARPYGGGLHGCVGSFYGTEVGAIALSVLDELPLRVIPGYAYTRQPGPLHRIEHLPLRVVG